MLTPHSPVKSRQTPRLRLFQNISAREGRASVGAEGKKDNAALICLARSAATSPSRCSVTGSAVHQADNTRSRLTKTIGRPPAVTRDWGIGVDRRVVLLGTRLHANAFLHFFLRGRWRVSKVTRTLSLSTKHETHLIALQT